MAYENDKIFGPYGGSVITFKNIFSNYVVELPGTIIDLELTYEITPTSNATPVNPFFLTLVSPLGIRVPVVGTKIEGGSFNNNGSLHVTPSPTTGHRNQKQYNLNGCRSRCTAVSC